MIALSALSLARQQMLSLSECGALLDDQYSIDRGVEAVLGKGAFGVVRPGVDRKSGDRVAAKFVEGPFREIVQEVCASISSPATSISSRLSLADLDFF